MKSATFMTQIARQRHSPGLTMKQMLTADQLELLAWIVERDADTHYLSSAKFLSPALIHNFTEAGFLEHHLGTAAYEAEHPDATALGLKSWCVVATHMKRCSLLGFPIHAHEHWTLLGQLLFPSSEPRLGSPSPNFRGFSHLRVLLTWGFA